ncbi:MAG: hypothetical protein COU10_00605 [Candidatus Harrisonbacteria bacterium CG10_big_fil_rev_8_21_14_0_10_45_28]|uniref:TQO small subunit DoxD domain-containing protein n=1 Tax=Candidatus Harrisonbacteria bacterium CG10_big_fil_rev_8_21_14_0_10_45_28 TaxID=1974586 RepID=A0A2H0UP14_9BACT|nr:MAG: hypothetical protein COU10_00605 [Candidatus Harrisonbacteria bacterium CG10_big_fil_rev_8_21_14_0_10_45_28]
MKNPNNNFSFSKDFFNNSKLTWAWLLVRLYVGYEWLLAGWGKITSPAWIGSDAGSAIGGFVRGAIAKSSGAHPAVQIWYARFLDNLVLPNTTLFSYVITFGELLIGIALILGLFTAIAAFFGAFMNLNFMLAGTTSINPILFTLTILIILARKPASKIGLDFYVLPHLYSQPNKPKKR